MAQLVQSFVGDTALRLQDEEFVRTMAWGSDWKKLNIAVNHSAPQFNGTVNTPSGYYVGLCEGATDTFKSASCVEWVGCWIDGTTGWNYTAGPPAGVQPNGGSNWKRGYKQGAVLTTSGNDAVVNFVPVTFRDYFIITIEQTAAGYLVLYRTPSVVPTLDTITSNFELIVNQTEQNTIRTLNFATNRRLDTVSIYWTLPSVGLEISEILVTRLA